MAVLFIQREDFGSKLNQGMTHKLVKNVDQDSASVLIQGVSHLCIYQLYSWQG